LKVNFRLTAGSSQLLGTLTALRNSYLLDGRIATFGDFLLLLL